MEIRYIITKSVARQSLDLCLKKQFKRLKPGIVLDVGAGELPYRLLVPHTKYMALDIDKSCNPDICCDIHDINWEDNYFDTIIATEVLEHCYNPAQVVDELYRILKKRGTVILSTRFMQHYHPAPKDYWRFTRDSLALLFKNFDKVEIHPHGNLLQVFWHFISHGRLKFVFNTLTPIIVRINFKKTRFPLGFVVYARK